MLQIVLSNICQTSNNSVTSNAAALTEPKPRISPKGLLFITLFNSILGLSVLFPIMAPLGRALGLSELQVGSLSASYALM